MQVCRTKIEIEGWPPAASYHACRCTKAGTFTWSSNVELRWQRLRLEIPLPPAIIEKGKRKGKSDWIPVTPRGTHTDTQSHATRKTALNIPSMVAAAHQPGKTNDIEVRSTHWAALGQIVRRQVFQSFAYVWNSSKSNLLREEEINFLNQRPLRGGQTWISAADSIQMHWRLRASVAGVAEDGSVSGPKRIKFQHCTRARVAQRWYVINSLPLATLVDEVRPMVIGVNACHSLACASLRINTLLCPQGLGSN